MAWIESHTVLIRHRKVVSFALQLGIKPVQAIGHLHALWHNALEQAEDGDLSKWSEGFIASAACWEGDPKIFNAALKDNRWVDNGLIHDWLDYAGRYLESKYRSSKPEILSRIKQKHDGSLTMKRRKSDFSQTIVSPPNLDNLTKITKPTTIAPVKPDAKVEGSRPVNWQNCTTDLQRVIATYVRVGSPHLYAAGACTKAQATAIFKVQGKPASAILAQCGDCATACRVIELAAKYYHSKGLDWSLHAVSKSCPDYLNQIAKEKTYGTR